MRKWIRGAREWEWKYWKFWPISSCYFIFCDCSHERWNAWGDQRVWCRWRICWSMGPFLFLEVTRCQNADFSTFIWFPGGFSIIIWFPGGYQVSKCGFLNLHLVSIFNPYFSPEEGEEAKSVRSLWWKEVKIFLLWLNVEWHGCEGRDLLRKLEMECY